MTMTGEEEVEGLNGTGRDKSEGDENELEEEKAGKAKVMRRLSQVAIPRQKVFHFLRIFLNHIPCFSS